MPAATTKLPPDSAALRAATLSFARKPIPVQSPPSASPRRKSISSSSRPVSRKSEVSLADLDRCPPRKTPSKDRENQPLLSPSSSALAANLAFARSTPSSPNRENVNMMTSPESQKGSSAVRARRRLFQDGAKGHEDTMEVPAGPPPLHKISPEHSRPGSPTKSPVDSNSLDDISSIKRIFESSGASSRPAPVVQSPKPLHPPNTSNPSVTAAVLATQLSSPPMSTRSSRSGSPVYRDSAPPTKRKPVPSKTAAPTVSPRSNQGPPVTSRRKSSRESLVSRASTTYTASTAPTTTTAPSASTALTAATLAQSTSPQPPRATAPQPPPPRSGRVSTNPDTAPTPPPPRKTHTTTAPSAAASTTSLVSPRPPPRTLDSGISLPSLSSRSNTPALSAARVSHGASTLTLPLSRSTTGGSTSTIAASLAPSRTTTPGPRKPPQPTPPQPRRQPSPQKSLPPTLRPTRPRSRSPSPPRRALKKTLHHAAARDKKYQRTISSKAKKRYEGLWAANRGYLLPPAQSQCICNIVVRELWKRSRLGNRVLGEIWMAVDRGGKGWLEREEFVVGTWLVDQALMGRKPPGRIQDVVFEGVAGGAKVPVPPPPRRQGTL